MRLVKRYQKLNKIYCSSKNVRTATAGLELDCFDSDFGVGKCLLPLCICMIGSSTLTLIPGEKLQL